jgi:CubicO group peptidase (beta-lactamase class C family)
VPDDKQAITIHHLLTHTSGLQDVFGDDFDTGATRDALLERILDSRLLSAPGETYRYSNAGYSLLGMIIEQVSGLDYEAFLRRNLFEPAGMLHTGYLLPAFDADNLAVGYRDGERWGTVLERPMLADGPGWNLRANGGIHSTAQDMYLWQRALEESRVLPPEAKEAYEHPWVDEGSGDTFYGYGWVNEETERGTRLLWHNGGNLVYSADARRYVDEDTFLFVASSVAEFQATALAEALDAVIFGGDITLPPRVQPRSSVDPDDFVGRYELRPGDTITLAARADGIEAIPEGCWAEYLLAGGRDRIAADANELRPRTLAILLAANEGDFGPLREETGSISERMEAKQGEYFGTQVRLGGALRDARVRRCVPFEGELKIIVRMDHDTATFYRWLRWVDGEITGYGFGELLAGGPERTMLFATESGTLVSFALGYETATELRVEHRADGSKALIIGAGDDRVVAPEAGLSR